MLELNYKHYRKYADAVHWKDYDNSELFFNCIKHEHDQEYDNWLAAIICRYWGLGARIYSQCNRHIAFEECMDIIIDSMKYVLEKRVWENPENSLYEDPKGPDKAMHVAIKRQKNIVISKYNAYRRLTNFNSLSLDGFRDSYNDAGEGWLTDLEQVEAEDDLYYFVSSYFKGDSYLDGFILDAICYSNSRSYDKKQVVSFVRNITLKDFDYYHNDYGADRDTFIKTLNELLDTTPKYLSIQINKLLYNLKEKEFNYD